jgi:hypothetical protein
VSVDEPRDLREEFELHGEFWLPGYEESPLAGVVRYSTERLTLSLTGLLRDPHETPVAETLVLGVTDGGIVTLQSLLPIRQNITNSGGFELTSSEYSVARLFVNAHFETDDAVRFKQMTFGFEGHDAWRAESPFEVTTEPADDGGSVTVARHHFPQDRERVELPDGAAAIERDVQFSRNVGGNALRWERRTGLRVEAAIPEPVEWFDGYQGDLRSLLSLLIGEPIAPIWVVGKLEGGAAANVGIYSRFTGKHSSRQRHPAEMLLSRKALGDRWEAVVTAWFQNRDKLRTTTNLFFGTLYDDDWFLEFQFIALTQALETFHRQLFGGRYVGDTEYELIRVALVKAIPHGTPDDLRSALKSRVQYGNQFSQRRRFKELLESLTPEGRDMVADGQDFVGRVVGERNYLTHYDESDDFVPMSHLKLHEMVVRLRAFLTLLLLNQLGISGSEAEGALKRTRWYRGFLGD